MCLCANGWEQLWVQNSYNESNRMCAAERWMHFICESALWVRAYWHVSVSTVAAAAACESLLFADALMYLQYGINETERSISRSEQMGHCVPIGASFYLLRLWTVWSYQHKNDPPEIRNSAVCVWLGKIMMINVTVIDLTVFRHIQSISIIYLSLRIIKSDANPVYANCVTN